MADLFNLRGHTIAITGAGGVLCGGVAQHLAGLGMKIAVIDLHLEAAEQVAAAARLMGTEAIAVAANVLDRTSMENALHSCTRALGPIEMLINGAGGNHPEATTRPDRSFFTLPVEAFEQVVDLNLLGTVVPSMVFGKIMAERGQGVILNIASMNAFRPLTRIPAYSAAKSAVKNFTEWLAVHMAREYSPQIRVNAIAPGFFLTHQNRYLLMDEKSGDLTARGKTILEHTPMNRFGACEDLYGTVVWLLAPASKYITGVTVPIDGGYNAFGGV